VYIHGWFVSLFAIKLFQAQFGPDPYCLRSSVDLKQVSMFQTLVLVLAVMSMCQQAPPDVSKVIRKRGLLPYPGLGFTPVTALGYPALSTHPFPAYTTVAYPRYGLRYPFAPTFPAYYPGLTIYGWQTTLDTPGLCSNPSRYRTKGRVKSIVISSLHKHTYSYFPPKWLDVINSNCTAKMWNLLYSLPIWSISPVETP
jgi:hypothetical protein